MNADDDDEVELTESFMIIAHSMYVGWDIWHTFGRRVWSSLQVCKLCAKGWRNNLLQFFCRISLSIQVFCNGNYGIARAQKKEIKKVTKFKVSKRVFLMLQFATAAVIFLRAS